VYSCMRSVWASSHVTILMFAVISRYLDLSDISTLCDRNFGGDDYVSWFGSVPFHS
jgi:hypothetical protein